MLSLSEPKLTFRHRQIARFRLYVVSTQQNACSFDVGSAHLALAIKDGTTRIWSSADCATGTRSLITALNRGVPAIVPISWGERTSAPGCTSPVRVVPAGTYTAYAVDSTLVSAPVTFRLR